MLCLGGEGAVIDGSGLEPGKVWLSQRTGQL